MMIGWQKWLVIGMAQDAHFKNVHCKNVHCKNVHFEMHATVHSWWNTLQVVNHSQEFLE